MLSRFKLLVMVCLLSVMAVTLQISNRANNPSVPELAGRWTVERIEVEWVRSYIWENLNFTIDRRGLIGNLGTPFTMTIFREDCTPKCYYVHDGRNGYPEFPLYKLVRESPDRLYLYPEYPATDKKVIFARVKE